jgi:hypothetical protein
MGGLGSGCDYHWWRPSKKTVVEDCRVLDASRWMREDILKADVWHRGRVEWFRDAERKEVTSSIGYELNTTEAGPWVRLFYTITKDGERVDYRVPLTVTRLPFGGLRWWFVCPLVVNDNPCKQRVGKLYLPPAGKYFGCRHCYRLTYTSCQESRKYDSLYRDMARRTGEDMATVKRRMNRLSWFGRRRE